MDTLVPLRVLLLEDHPYDAELTIDQLVQAGYAPEWHRVDTEREYLAYLEPTLDIILADYNMPQFNAIRALELLKERQLDIPFIVVSGSIGEELAVRSMKQGATDYVLKDRMARLGEAVKQALRQKDSQEALVQAEIRFSKAFHFSPVGIVMVELETGSVLDANESLLIMLGQKPEEVIGHNVADLGDGNTSANHSDLSKYLRQTQAVRGLEVEFIAKSGEARQALISAELIELGNKPCILSFVYDITDRKSAEAELLKTELLRVELEKEKELLDLKQRFISTVTHEFRTPLAVILTASTLVEQYYDRLSPAKRTEHLQHIQHQVRYMDELLSDVLDFNKAQLGKIDFAPELVDIRGFCAEIFEQLQIVDAGAHQFVFTDRNLPDQVYLDQNLLRHILVNLLSNAIKYSPKGGQIGFNLFIDDTELIFSISDQGIGIPIDDQKHLFEPFHRAKNAGEIQGTGLGLAIVRSNVEAHRGTITCESQANIGTTFTVHIPIKG
jgi:PAS domain S-box-containing protein